MNRRSIQAHGPSIVTAAALGLLCLNAGCATTNPEREARMAKGYVFYCDGSGGGGKLMNYAQGVRKGLVDAGYEGAGEMFPWHTGLGFAADHSSSAGYKRGKATTKLKKLGWALWERRPVARSYRTFWVISG